MPIQQTMVSQQLTVSGYQILVPHILREGGGKKAMCSDNPLFK